MCYMVCNVAIGPRAYIRRLRCYIVTLISPFVCVNFHEICSMLETLFSLVRALSPHVLLHPVHSLAALDQLIVVIAISRSVGQRWPAAAPMH